MNSNRFRFYFLIKPYYVKLENYKISQKLSQKSYSNIFENLNVKNYIKAYKSS